MNLNPQQQRAVDIDSTRIILSAGAGSGKTRVLTQRIVRLLGRGFHPAELLALTFTNAAADEMKERVTVALGDDRPWRAKKLRLSTFHSWCAEILREYADKIGYDRNFTIRDEVDKADLVRYAAIMVGKCPEPGQKKKSGQWTSVKRLWQEADVVSAYYQLLKEAQAFDYDSLQTTLSGLIERDAGARRELQARWAHVLVDEYQDTGADQQRLLGLLAPNNLFVVGDHAQSIYGFRGAKVNGFVERAQDPTWSALQLPTNYRSRPEIVDAANRVGAAMQVPGLEMDAGRASRETVAVPLTEPLIALDESLRGATERLGGPTRLAYLELVEADLQWHVEADGRSWRDLACLAPTWRKLEQLAEHLKAAGIPHRIAKRTPGVWTTDAARWVVNCLRVAVQPADHVALWSVLTAFTPRVRMGAWAKVRGAAMREEQLVLDRALVDLADTAAGPLLSVIAQARDLVAAGDGATAVLKVCSVLMGTLIDDLHLPSKAKDVHDFHAAVREWAARTAEGDEATPEDSGVAAFLYAFSFRELEAAEPVGDEAPDEVTLTTIHGAKGLEWPCVWVLGCEPGSLPRSEDPEAPAYQEELRLFYVALTRAQDRLRLCWSEHRGRSPFVDLALGPDDAVVDDDDDLSGLLF